MTKDEAIEKAFTNYLEGDTIDVCLGRWSAESFYAGYAAAKPRWIPVEERLPEFFGTYLATVGDYDEVYFVMPVWFDRVDMEFKTNDHYRANPGNVIAWMPLPEPFEPKDK